MHDLSTRVDALRRVASGEPIVAVARGIGVHASTVCRWLGEDGRAAAARVSRRRAAARGVLEALGEPVGAGGEAVA